MAEELDHYDKYLLALGRLCATWAVMDSEVVLLLAAMLKTTPAQASCIATEMNDIAPRCRLIKTLSYTVDAPKGWREDVAELCNIVANQIGPARNRFIHDRFGVDEDKIFKTDRRAKLLKGQSFADFELAFNRDEVVDKDAVETVAAKAMIAASQFACVRFDMEHLHEKGRFPEQPALERRYVRLLPQLQLQPDD